MSFRRILTAAVGVPETATDDEIALAMAEMLRGQTAVSSTEPANLRDADDPQAAFHDLARRTSEVLGISLGDAYSRVSAEAPTLYERASAKARLN
jgi:hypothetical protein